MKYLLNDKELSSLSELMGESLVHISDEIGSFVVNDVKIDDMKIQNRSNKKWYSLENKYYKNFEIIITPQMITPKFFDDETKKDQSLEYHYNAKENLYFLDYYVPFGHRTRKQVSYILDRDITVFSDNIYNYRHDTGYEFTISNSLFKKTIEEISDLLETEQVILVDLLGLLHGKELDEDNLIYIDAHTLSSGHLIEKISNEQIKGKPDDEAKKILERKYILNNLVSDKISKEVKHCYIFDDVYTRGNTTNHIKQLIINHNGFLIPNFTIVTYAKTVRYTTNFFTYDCVKKNSKKNVLFVCNKNMTRSILAEAIARNEFTELNTLYNFYSVGIQQYAGREICDVIYDYINKHNIYDDTLIPQRLTSHIDESWGINEGTTIIEKNWLIIVLDKGIKNKVEKQYNLSKEQLYVYDLPDICDYDNHNKEYYDNAEHLANKIRIMIKEVFLENE
ncbi:MAG: arsenate reductase/protein-tyrosine-phosphatase family protein [Candidatus Izemoplasmataceae bacterium]